MDVSRRAVATYILFVIVSILGLWVIRELNITYPVSVTTKSVSGELAVVGEGKVDVVPDSASVEAGIVVNNADTVGEARNQIDEVNNKIVDALGKLGIDKKDIKTSNYSVTPNYTYDTSGGTGKISGYNGNVNISIKVKKTDMLAQVIEAATAAGANNIYNTQYSVEDPAKYREEARQKAIDNAKEQAEALADQLGIRLGKVVNIVESSPGQVPPMYYEKSAEMVGGGGAPDLQPGSQTITSTVTLYFEKN